MFTLPSLTLCLSLCLFLVTKGVDANDQCHDPSCTDKVMCQYQAFGDTCCYKYTDGKRSWEENKRFCQSRDMILAKIPKNLIFEKFNLQELAGSAEDSVVWLGGKVKDFEDWVFVNGCFLNDTYKSIHPPLQGDNLKNQCGVMNYLKFQPFSEDSLEIGISNCSKSHHFICRFEDWKKTKTFYVSESPTNWFDARTRCKQLGGDLFFLEKGENVRILQNKLCGTNNQTFFIGLTHEMGRWEDGQDIIYGKWENGKPGIPGENCLAVNLTTGSLIRKDCETSLSAMCQRAKTNKPSQLSLLESLNIKGWPVIVLIFTSGALLCIAMQMMICLLLFSRCSCRTPSPETPKCTKMEQKYSKRFHNSCTSCKLDTRYSSPCVSDVRNSDHDSQLEGPLEMIIIDNPDYDSQSDSLPGSNQEPKPESIGYEDVRLRHSMLSATST